MQIEVCWIIIYSESAQHRRGKGNTARCLIRLQSRIRVVFVLLAVLRAEIARAAMLSAPTAKPAETGAVPGVITIPPNTPLATLANQISVY